MNKLFAVYLFILVFILLVYIIHEIVYENLRKNLRKLAKDVITAFNKNNVNYWVDYGTLLGIVRDKDIIKYDQDVDICLLPEPDLCDKLKKVITELGEDYTLEYHAWGAYRIVLKHYILRVYADLYLVKEENGMYTDPTGKIPIDLVGKTTIVYWKEIPVRVPEKIHETLVWRYGHDYNTPIRGKQATNGV
jgi:hypothetical protein